MSEQENATNGVHSIRAIFKAGYRALRSPIPPGPADPDKFAVLGALSSSSTTAKDDVERTARLSYVRETEGEPAKLMHILGSIASCEIRLAEECGALQKKRRSLDPHVRINDDATPIPWSSLVQITLIATVCLGLMCVPLLGIPAYMLQFVTTSLVLAISTAFLGLALMVGLKCLSLAFKTEAGQLRFLMVLCFVAVILLVGWTALFATSYGGMIVSESTELPPEWLGMLLMGFGMLAEPLIGAIGWIGIERVLKIHRSHVPNAEYVATERQLAPIADQLGKLRVLRALIDARRQAHAAAEQLHVDRSVALYLILRRKRDFFDGDDFLGGVIASPRKPLPTLP